MATRRTHQERETVVPEQVTQVTQILNVIPRAGVRAYVQVLFNRSLPRETRKESASPASSVTRRA
jgi:hypothetical protein